jgi:hypothetical protein
VHAAESHSKPQVASSATLSEGRQAAAVHRSRGAPSHQLPWWLAGMPPVDRLRERIQLVCTALECDARAFYFGLWSSPLCAARFQATGAARAGLCGRNVVVGGMPPELPPGVEAGTRVPPASCSRFVSAASSSSLLSHRGAASSCCSMCPQRVVTRLLGLPRLWLRAARNAFTAVARAVWGRRASTLPPQPTQACVQAALGHQPRERRGTPALGHREYAGTQISTVMLL